MLNLLGFPLKSNGRFDCGGKCATICFHVLYSRSRFGRFVHRLPELSGITVM